MKKNARLFIRLLVKHKKQLKADAKKAGLSLSAYVIKKLFASEVRNDEN